MMMLRSFRLIRFAVLGLALVWTAPSFAQNFEGLDLGGQSKSKKKKKGASSAKSSKKKKPTRGAKGKTTPAPVEEDGPDESALTPAPTGTAPSAVTGPAPTEATPAPAPTPTPP
ncbi:hypothetical protein HUW62_47000, partial [Myxococcus sp. AM011]|nr:hypothetical protein [Myxococcus sp. AM011]